MSRRRRSRARGARRRKIVLAALAALAVTVAVLEKQPSYGAATQRTRTTTEHAIDRTEATTHVVSRQVTTNGLTAQVDPADGIINQVVKVSWSGFHPSDQLGDWAVLIYQCKADPASLSDCYTDQPFPGSAGGNAVLDGVTGANGDGVGFFEVRNSSKLPALNCSNTVPCSLLVWENDGNPPPTNSLPSTSVVVPIAFARSSADCPVPNHLDVRAEGEASGANLFYDWVGQLCQGSPKLQLDYTETSSNNGREDELAGDTDVGVTSLGATPAELKTSSTHKTYEYAPLDLNAVVVTFNIDDSVTGAPITDITLTPRLVARLVTDSDLLEFFSDPEFLKLNPGHSWPTLGASQPLLRAERNADTRLLTTWMIDDPDAKNFVAGHDKYGIQVTPDFLNKPYPVDNFEKAASDDGFDPLTGEDLIALHTFYGVKPADAATTRPTVEGFFGVMDRSTAQQYDLPMAKLVNHAGAAVAPDDAGVNAGYKAMTTLDGVKVAAFDSSDTAAYPLPKIDYAMVRHDVTTVDSHGAVVADPAKAKNIASFLGYEAGPGQQHLLGGYLPLPAAEVAGAKKVAADLATPVAPHTTTTTTAAAVTTPEASDFGSCCSDTGSDLGSDVSTEIPTAPAATSPTEHTKANGKRATASPKVQFVAAQAPEWSPAGSGGSNGPSPLWFVMVLGLAALAARIAWYTSPKVLTRVRARASTHASTHAGGRASRR